VSRCLGARVADLADGRLEPAEAERAFAHVAACASCRAALAAQRATSSRLASGEGVDAPDDLLQRLRGIPAQPYAGPTAPTQGGAGMRPSGAAGARPSGRGEQSARRAARRRRSRVAVAAAAGAAALAVAAVVGGGTSALTGAVAPRPAIAPVVDTFAVEHVMSADQMPFSGPRIVTAGYTGSAVTASPTPEP
jgi:hypothetical protein